MLLNDVLRIIAAHIDPLGYRRVDTYKLLFDGILDKIDFNVDDTVKQLFSGSRALTIEMTRAIGSSEYFKLLTQNIQYKYLTITGNHIGLFEELSALIKNCTYLTESHKKQILASCDYVQPAELARFIGACIVCGNYNTKQAKSKTTLVGQKSVLNFDYMNLAVPAEELLIKEELWQVSKRAYVASHNYGNRFYSLNIIQRLLPQGYVTNDYFLSRGKTEDGKIAPLLDLCSQSNNDLAIIGVGGIGKTTFLQQLLKNEFFLSDGAERVYANHRPVPFFIELNRCPEHIDKWYDVSLRKTNFITRYISQLYENHGSLDSISSATLDKIEKELQKVPVDGKAQYLLLLDGFNEVRTSKSVRTYLSNEISVLHEYPNVRIITTSRETQTAYYASEFDNIRLVGVEEDDIIAHLQNCKVPEPIIGEALACESLAKCLRIPLYLCMFSAEKADEYFLPETAGEILYCFFHRNSAFYNARHRVAETRTNCLSSQQTVFVLDFILPFVGWSYENKDIFSMNEQDFRKTIEDAMSCICSMLIQGHANPFSDFKYSTKLLKSVAESFYEPDGALITDIIISCIYDYLGIVYQYEVKEGNYVDRIRYSFCHHHFRDYFSAIWDIQLLSMLKCIEPKSFYQATNGNNQINTFNYFLNNHYWQSHKVSFVSQILMEHRNRPQLNSTTQNWYLPRPQYDEQRVLSNALDFCRELCKEGFDIHHLLQNILSAISFERQEFSGLDLSNLNFKHCRFFNVTCSRKGRTKTLAAKFDGSILTEENFTPESHLDNVMEYVYSGNKCFTIDDAGTIKCWDVLSGKLEYELSSENPLGVSDFSNKGFVKISNDRNWLITKVQTPSDKGMLVYLNLFDLQHPDQKPKQFSPSSQHNILTYFCFTEDSKSLLMLCDRSIVYCFDISSGKINYCHNFPLLKHSELYADTSESTVFAFSGEYNAYDTAHFYSETFECENDQSNFEIEKYEDKDCCDDEYTDLMLPPPCQLCVLNPNTGESFKLYGFVGAPETAPTAAFFPTGSYFVLYNFDKNSIEKYDCISGEVTPLFEELIASHNESPSAIHPHPEHPNECYIVYPDVCYDVDINSVNGNGILMKYSISGVEKLIPHSNQDGELTFKPNVIPTNNHFIVSNDTNTYEWDTENETLLLKYNCAFYGCTAFFPNAAKDICILVHQYNGISIFAGIPLKLVNQFCFREPDYFIGNCCYDENHNCLAMTFARPDHEKIMLLDMLTSKQKIIFSTIYRGESIETLCFSEDGKYLLMTSQYQCLEYDIEQQQLLLPVVTAGPNERLATGNYNGNEIEVSIVEDSAVSSPKVMPSCKFYSRISIQGEKHYICQWYYNVPELPTELFQYFIYQNNDLGIEGAKKDNGMQSYWITRGFFLENLDELKDILHPKCYIRRGKRFVRFDKEFHPLDMICVRHTSAITNIYRIGNSNCSYMYLSDDLKEAILTKDCNQLSYITDLQSLTYEQLETNFNKNMGSAEGYAYWDFAIPWYNKNLIGCYEAFHLIGIDLHTGKLTTQINYYPGIAICGCSFKNVQTDKDTIDIILCNGGHI